MGSDSQQPSRILWPSGNRPPGIRRFSKESKVPNKRERKSFRVYVEVSRAQHPASKPELEADGFGQSTAISNPMAFRKQATRDTTLFERKQGSKQKRKKELSCLCWSFKSSTPSLQARTRGGWVRRVKDDLQTYGLQKQATRDTTLFERKQGSKQKRKKELSCLCWSFKSSTPSLQARTRGGWVRVKSHHLQAYGLQKGYDALRKKARFHTKEKERAFVSMLKLQKLNSSMHQ